MSCSCLMCFQNSTDPPEEKRQISHWKTQVPVDHFLKIASESSNCDWLWVMEEPSVEEDVEFVPVILQKKKKTLVKNYIWHYI